MENNIVTPEKLEALKKFSSVRGYWGIYTEKTIVPFTCTDYVLDQLNPERGKNVPFLNVPPQFKDTPLDFFYNLNYNDKEIIDKLNNLFSLIEKRNKFETKSILAVIPRPKCHPILNILFSEEWKKDSYRVSGILKVIRNWHKFHNSTLIKEANNFDRSLSDFLYIALEGKLDKVNKNCPFTGWKTDYVYNTLHGMGGIYCTRSWAEKNESGFSRKTNMIPLLTKINEELDTYEMPKL